MNITISVEKIINLCIKNNWFTCGDNSQYKRLFERVMAGAEIDEIATIIWICSENVTKEEIVNNITVPVKNERIELVKAMELIARTVNDEFVFDMWLTYGIADGDITDDADDEELEYYTEDENFADLMETFLDLMSKAKKSGCLYSDGIVSESKI